MWNLKRNNTIELIKQSDFEDQLMAVKGKDGGKGQLGSLGWTCTHYIENGLTNKDLLYSTENYIQYPMINHKGEEFLKKNVFIYMYT